MERLRAALERLRELDPNALPDPNLGRALNAAPEGIVLPAVKPRRPETPSPDAPPDELLDAQAEQESPAATGGLPADVDAADTAGGAPLPSLETALAGIPPALLERIDDLFKTRPKRVVRIPADRLLK